MRVCSILLLTCLHKAVCANMGVAQVSFGNGFKIKLRKHDC